MDIAGKPIFIQGVEYPSRKMAAETLGVSASWVSRAYIRGSLDTLGTGERKSRKKTDTTTIPMSIKLRSDGLLSVSGAQRLHNGLWVECTPRKVFPCAFFNIDYPSGTRAYRPTGGGRLQAQRIAAQSIELVLAR